MEKSRKRLTLNERVIIETLLTQNRSKSYIAIQLNRNRSSITREINTWVKKPTDYLHKSLKLLSSLLLLSVTDQEPVTVLVPLVAVNTLLAPKVKLYPL